jgi:hypothetical protein
MQTFFLIEQSQIKFQLAKVDSLRQDNIEDQCGGVHDKVGDSTRIEDRLQETQRHIKLFPKN